MGPKYGAISCPLEICKVGLGVILVHYIKLHITPLECRDNGFRTPVNASPWYMRLCHYYDYSFFLQVGCGHLSTDRSKLSRINTINYFKYLSSCDKPSPRCISYFPIVGPLHISVPNTHSILLIFTV